MHPDNWHGNSIYLLKLSDLLCNNSTHCQTEMVTVMSMYVFDGLYYHRK